MLQSACYVESSTIYDDAYLNFNDLYESAEGGEHIESKICSNANGFSYVNDNDYRVIIWRVLGNRLDLIEQSLVNKLNSNAKHIYFNNSTIIPSSVYICKQDENIQVLLSTTNTLYRFIIPIRQSDSESIFSMLNADDLFSNQLNSYDFNLQHIKYCANYVQPLNGDALYAFTMQNNSLQCIRLPAINSQNNMPVKYELNQPNIVKRILSGIRRTVNDTQSILVSYKLVSVNDQTYVISLCQDLKIKIWNLKTSDLYIEDLYKYIKTNDTINWDESRLDIKAIDDTQAFMVVFSIKLNDQLHVYWFHANIVNAQPSVKFYDTVTFTKYGRFIETYFNEKNVWLLSKNERDELQVNYKSVDDNLNDRNQITVLLQKQSDRDDEIVPLRNIDLKENYLKLIFEPYKFSKSTICKALGIFRKSAIRDNEVANSLESLKEIIIQVIENEVQNCTEEDEFLDVTNKCWAKFYSILLQYNDDSRLPLGLFVDSRQSFLLLVRKNSMSVFTKADLTQLYTSRQLAYDSIRPCFEPTSTSANRINKDGKLLKDLNYLFNVLNCINEYYTKSQSIQLDENEVGVSMDNVENNSIDLTIDKLIANFENFFNDVEVSLQKITNFSQINEFLIDYFASLHKSSDTDMDCFDAQNTNSIESEFTINCLLSSFKNLIQKRHEFLRNFCILLNLLKRYSEKFNLQSHKTDESLSTQIKTLTTIYNSYDIVKWLCDTYPYPIHKTNIETNLRRTNELLNNNAVLNRSTLINQADLDKTILQLYINQFSKNILTNISLTEISTYWLPSILNDIFKLTWPLNGNYDFIKFLMHNIQYVHLYNYCMQLKWWQEGKYLRYFLLAHCCLYWNEIDKSIDLFLKASFNLDDLIIKDFLLLNDLSSLSYYTKIIHYYDLNGNIDAIIELIHKAIPSCKCDINRSKLYCILFKSYMDLEYYEQAFDALMTNTDIEWKRNCLKQFIIELCNQNKASILINFEYSYMQEYVKEILYKRALSSDLRTHDYYSILYSFYLKNSDYIKAATCMYEYALRLKKEQTGLASLIKQEKCYLACLNCIKLVNSDYAWLCLQQQNEAQDDSQIVKYDDINKAYLIVHYLIKVSSFTANQSSIATYYSVEELVGLLVKYGLFDDAIILCLTFKPIESSPLISIFIGLVDRCCKTNVVNSVDELQLEVEWLKHNESLPPSATPYENPNSLKWRLLQTYLERYKDVVYYKAVCKRILTLGFEIPNYILTSFKILINYGLLEDAYDLCIDYIDALLTNRGIDRFDIKNALHAHNYPVLLPYSSIDQLLLTLKSIEERDLKNLYDKLTEKLEIYFNTVKDVSESKLNSRPNNIGIQHLMKTY